MTQQQSLADTGSGPGVRTEAGREPGGPTMPVCSRAGVWVLRPAPSRASKADKHPVDWLQAQDGVLLLSAGPQRGSPGGSRCHSPLDSLTSLDHFHFPAPVFLPSWLLPPEDGPAAASICRPSEGPSTARAGREEAGHGDWTVGGTDLLRSGQHILPWALLQSEER